MTFSEIGVDSNLFNRHIFHPTPPPQTPHPLHTSSRIASNTPHKKTDSSASTRPQPPLNPFSGDPQPPPPPRSHATVKTHRDGFVVVPVPTLGVARLRHRRVRRQRRRQEDADAQTELRSDHGDDGGGGRGRGREEHAEPEAAERRHIDPDGTAGESGSCLGRLVVGRVGWRGREGCCLLIGVC